MDTVDSPKHNKGPFFKIVIIMFLLLEGLGGNPQIMIINFNDFLMLMTIMIVRIVHQSGIPDISMGGAFLKS